MPEIVRVALTDNAVTLAWPPRCPRCGEEKGLVPSTTRVSQVKSVRPNLMGGTLSVDSTPGAGSTFRLELTLGAAQGTTDAVAPPAQAVADERRLAGLHLLVAEDNPVNLQVVVAMLEGLGARVDSALDGAQAVARCRNGRFDALLMDCQMPAMDGYEAARHILAERAALKRRTTALRPVPARRDGARTAAGRTTGRPARSCGANDRTA